MSYLKDKFRNSPLFVKICTIIYTLMLIFALVLLIVPFLMYKTEANNRLKSQSYTFADNVVSVLNMHYNNLLHTFIGIYGTEDFADAVDLTCNGNLTPIATKNLLQDYLKDFGSSSYIVDNVLIINASDKKMYSRYEAPLKPMNSIPFSDDELAGISGITWLPARTSPFRKSAVDIPVVFPLTLNKSGYVTVTSEGEEVNVYVVAYLSTSTLNDVIIASIGQHDNSAFTIYSYDGGIISQSTNFDESDDEIFRTKFFPVITDTSSNLFFQTDYACFRLKKLDKCNIFLAYRLKSASFLENAGVTPTTIISICLFILLVLIAISVLMSKYVTKPVNALVKIVHRIENGTYDDQTIFETTDEIGKLGKAINSMHSTIEAQMEQIKEDEAEKYMAQIRLMAEQVNPHFLYNTLDSIQTEVRTGSSESAADMIQYLANYLRIGLSYGDDFITLSKEINHANAYVQLMNHRFRQSILFMYQLPKDLEMHPILKTIFQPLIENSIRHGFGIDADGLPILTPTIEINVSRIASDGNDKLRIEIIDNGSGFDIEKTVAIMLTDNDAGKRHVGLHNVYYRLITYYGKEHVDVIFESIPYYKNSVTITLPMRG